MKVITRRDAIKNGVSLFIHRYGNGTYIRDSHGIQVGAELKKFDLNFIDRQIVDELIGNRNFTCLICDECHIDSECVVEFMNEAVHNMTFQFCYQCIKFALDLIENVENAK